MSKEVTKEMMEPSFPKIAPYNGVTDYLTSKAVLERVQVRSYQWDIARHDPEVTLTSVRRKFDRTEKALAEKREYYKEIREKLDEQWKEIREKEMDLKVMFEDMNNFIKNNEIKRIRARERFIEESKMLAKRIKDIAKLEKKLALVNEAKKAMDSEIAMHKLYEKYLDVVISLTEDFKNTNEIIDRYESLCGTKKELGELQTANLELLELTKLKMAKMTDENTFRILGLNNVVANLNGRFTQAANNAMHWESLVWAIKARAFEKFQEVTEVKQACWNIYRMMCKRKGEPVKIAEGDMEKLMSYIKGTLNQMKIVREEVVQISKKTFSSTKGQTSKVS